MGIINVYKGINYDKEVIKANGKLKDILPNYDFSNTLVLKEGNKLNPEYEVQENDVLFLRVVPTGLTTTAITTIAVTAAVVVAGAVVGGVLYNQNKELQEQLEKAQANNKNDTTKLPFLKGAKNQSALGKTIPYIMGEMYHTPYTLNNGFYSISGTNGETQKWNAILVSGYNDQRLKSVSIGNTKIADYNPNDYSQDGIKPINTGIYQTESNECKIEVCTNDELLLDGLNQKVVAQVYETEVKHDNNSDAEPVIEQLAENAMRVEVCIRFDGLRQYDSDRSTYIAREVEVVPYWTNNPDAANPTWHSFNFDVINDGSATYTWVVLEGQDITNAINSGYIKQSTTHVQTGMSSYTDVTTYTSNSSDYRVTLNGSLIDNPAWTFEHKQTSVSAGNKIIRNTDKTCRFVASKTFTAAESFGKNISVKLVRVTEKASTQASETCILQYIQTWCYDAQKSTASELVSCKPMENPYRDNTTRIGLTMVANANTQNVLDEINIITTGIARTWNGAQWSTDKKPTRNPAAWILELLTSNKHYKSKYLDSEIDLISLGDVYEYCEENDFYCDGIITDGKKKREVIQSILSSIFVDMVLNSEGKLEFIIDKKETNPVALLNSQNVASITYSKSFERSITGLKTTYIDRNNWASVSEYFMRNGSTTYKQDEDVLSELTLDYVTTHDHAYKVAQRQQRHTVLQPRTITVNVGMEGDYYPLHSTVLLQIERFKQGIHSATVHKCNTENGYIKSIELSDVIEFAANYNYGLIIQAQSNYGKRLIYSKVKVFDTTTKTNTVELIEPIEVSGIVPTFNNVVSVGLLNTDGSFSRVTNVMKITGVKPGDNHGFELELKDYNPEIYEYGTIPAYRSNLTSRPVTEVKPSEVKPIDYEGLGWEVQGEIDRFEEEVNERIDGIVTSATVCSMSLSNVVLEIDDEGFTQTVQTFETVVTLKRSEINLTFSLGEMTLPSGFTLTEVKNEDKAKRLKFTVGEGVQVNAGYFVIPVVYKQVISSSPFVDENNAAFVDEKNEEFIDLIFGEEGTTWELNFNYIGNGYSRYLGKFSNLSEIPTTTNIGDYFVWAGTNRTASSLAYEGFFRQAQTYKYVGTGKVWAWEVDTNSGHMQSALSDVLSIANADLENNNSTVWAYLDHLTANSVYCDMLVANEGFIDKLSAKIITSELVTTKGLSETLEGYETKDGLTEELKKYVESNKLFAEGSPTLKDGTLDIDSIKNIAIRDGKTLIAGGYINTNVLDVETITAGLVKTTTLESNYASISYLEGGNATFKGTVTATKGKFLGTINQGLSSYTLFNLRFSFEETFIHVYNSTLYDKTGDVGGIDADGKIYVRSRNSEFIMTRISTGIYRIRINDTYMQNKFPAIWEDETWTKIQLLPQVRFCTDTIDVVNGVTYGNARYKLEVKIKKGASHYIGYTSENLNDEVKEALYEPFRRGRGSYGTPDGSWWHDNTNHFYEFYLIVTDYNSDSLYDPVGSLDIIVTAYFF